MRPTDVAGGQARSGLTTAAKREGGGDDPSTAATTPYQVELLAYIEAVATTPRPDCMIWPNAVDRGYGRISVNNTDRRVHRVVWELKHGPIPEGMTIDHLCRIRPCCNTEHMELVTAAENIRRKPALPRQPKQRRSRTRTREPRTPEPKSHCPNGHEYTPENTRLNSRGWRNCLECKRAQDRKYEATRGPRVRNRSRASA